MENIHTNFVKKKYFLIACISIVFTEFYYFNWGSRALISNNYLLLNSLILFFSLIFFLFIFNILKKKKK